MSIETDVAEIKTKVAYIEKEIKANLVRFEEHINTAQPFRDRVSMFDSAVKKLDDHIVQDRWVQGTIFLGIIGIFVKLFL